MLGISARPPLPISIRGGHADVDAPTDNTVLRLAPRPWSRNSETEGYYRFQCDTGDRDPRVAVPIIKRSAADPEANSFLRAEQLVVKI